MIVVVAARKVKTAIVMFLVFCSDDSNSNGKVTKQISICEKLVGNGSVMDNYVRCDSSCNSYNIG